MGPNPKKNWRKNKKSKTDPLGDTRISLADFADADVPVGCNRVKKSKSNLPLSRDSVLAAPEDDEEDLDIDTVLVGGSARARKVAATKIDSTDAESDSDSNDQWLTICDEIWIMLSEYMRPQDVLKFSLICKSTYRIVNSPLFWIKIYRRYYTSKVYMPAFLKKHCLERHLGLKANVVRSLYYTYAPFHESLRRPKTSLRTVIGQRCELMWVQRARDKDTNDDNERWIYSFKLSNKPDVSHNDRRAKRKTVQDIINHNPDETCCLFEIICKEYVDPKCVIGMKLRKAAIEDRCVQLKFSSAPLSRFGTDFGAIDIHLNATQPPAIYHWWHPHFYNQQY